LSVLSNTILPSGYHTINITLPEIIETQQLYFDQGLQKGDEIRVWKNAEYREENKPSVVVQHDAGDAGQFLKTYMEEETAEADANCVYYRHELEKFTIIDRGNQQNSIKWDHKSSFSLGSFRQALKKLFDKSRGLRTTFAIFESGTIRKYVVNKETTEEEWRKHIYDWFHHSELQVMRSVGIDYCKPSHNINLNLNH